MSPTQTSTTPTPVPTINYRPPSMEDGRRLWEIASDSQVLDVNSPYAYVLWCHDFAATSIVAEIDGRPIGFVTGYQRPDDPAVLMVWQVAVDRSARGNGVAATMLHKLFLRGASAGMVAMHTTISPDNEASQRLFASVAAARGLEFRRQDLFDAALFPDAHQPEQLYRLEPPVA